MVRLSRVLGGGLLWGIAQAWLTLAAFAFAATSTLTTGTSSQGAVIADWSIGEFFYLTGVIVAALSFLAGSILSRIDPTAKPLLLSQFTATSLFIISVIAFPSAFFPYFPPPAQTDILAKLSGGVLAIYSIASFFLATIGGYTGMLAAERLHTKWRAQIHPLRGKRILLSALVILLSVSITLPLQAQITGLQAMADQKVLVSLVNNKGLIWDAGVENITADLGPVPKGSGSMIICWTGNTTTFYVIILSSLVKKSATLSCQFAPFASWDDFTVFKAWFHNDLCLPSSTCPAGRLTYSITLLY